MFKEKLETGQMDMLMIRIHLFVSTVCNLTINEFGAELNAYTYLNERETKYKLSAGKLASKVILVKNLSSHEYNSVSRCMYTVQSEKNYLLRLEYGNPVDQNM